MRYLTTLWSIALENFKEYNTEKNHVSTTKIYSADIYKEALEKAWIPSYDSFHSPDVVYSDFNVVNIAAPIKTVPKETIHVNGSMETLQGKFTYEINYFI